MEFGLLGPLLVRSGGLVLPVQRGNQRALLATLLLAANKVVLVEEIAHALWGPRQPPSANVSVRNYVRRLRQALGDDSPDRISTQPRGYMISVGAGELDTMQFEVTLESASSAARDGRWDTAADLARAALALWRGEPLADVESDVLAFREVPRLSELRLRALELRLDADLRLGRHADTIAELQALTRAHPLRERVHALLMLALFGCGRQGEALEAYQNVRRTLVEELGVEPGGELRALHQQLLTADQAPSVPVPVPGTAGPPAAVIARQLPRAAAHFTGRAAEMAELSAMLGRVGTGAISVISGMAGVGKTALATRWAHEVASYFGDGHLHVNLRGFDPAVSPATPEEAIRELLHGLALPAEQIPHNLSAQVGLYRSLLADRRMLIVLDNARDEQQVRPLLPGASACAVLITSRSQLVGLAAIDGAHLLTLDALSPVEARQMLTGCLGAARAATDSAAVSQIARLCGFLPLALAVCAARAAADRGRPLSAVAAELQDAAGRLDALDTGDPMASVRAVFSWSIHHVTPAAAGMYRLLGLHPGPDITVAAAASLADVTPAAARRELVELTRAHLITEHIPGRYTMHDLLRAYATEQARAIDEEQIRGAAITRVLDHYLHAARAADGLLNPARDGIVLAARADGVRSEPLADYDQAMAWFGAEHKVLLRVIRLAVDAGADTHAWQIPWTMVDFCEFTGRWHDWIATQRGATEAAGRLGDPGVLARCCRALGYALARAGRRDDEAIAYLRRALRLFRETGDRIGAARAHQDLSWLLDRQGRPAAALRHDRIALRLYEAAGHKRGQANVLNAIGWLEAVLGEHAKAIDCCRRALELHREVGNRRGEAATLDSLGYACHCLGRHGESLACYQRSLALFRELADRSNEAEILTHIGDAHDAAGNAEQARDAWEQALAILDDLQAPGTDQVRAKLAVRRARAE
jgi:DNA-binding SARP family transcriptional activator/tetratricopeptide (TPR) repeat protein